MKGNKVAVIDFTKFDIQQLPELQGKKEEIKKVIKENPVVKVTDNASYELAKKSRTAVKTLRTSLEKEKKEVNDRIKNNVLLVVANEYDSLIADVRNDENARQEEVSAWEEKKEQERLEKLRLEQERVDGIKKSIHDFRENNEKFIASCVFESIEATKEVFEKSVSEFDREKLAEFEVLFDDTVAYLHNLLEARISTLTEQENIRLAKIEIEKEQERQRIAAEKAAETQRIQLEKIEAEQKRVAEEQRIAQENFLREKREFEEKQAEAKFQERKKFLADEDYWRIYLLAECAEEEHVAKGKLLNYTDSEFEDFKLAVLKAKEPVVESNEFAKEEWHEEDVDAKGISDKNFKPGEDVDFHPKEISEAEESIVFDALTEETWEDIFAEWRYKLEHQDGTDVYFSLESYLQSNFNTPTRKQQ
jgi:hypothetical protein